MKVILTEDQFNRLILKEENNNDLLTEGKLNDIFKKFNITQIKKELKERLGIDETSNKTEVAKKLMKYMYNLNLKLLKYELGAVLGGFIFYFLSIVLDVAGVEPFVTDGEPTIPHFILWGAGALLNVIRLVRKDLKEEYGRTYSVQSMYDVLKDKFINDKELMYKLSTVLDSPIGAVEDFEIPHSNPQGLSYKDSENGLGVDGPHGIVGLFIIPKLKDLGLIKGNMDDPNELKWVNDFATLLYNDIKPSEYRTINMR